MQKRSFLGLGLCLSMLITSNVWAWGDLGHATVGYIAEKNLTRKAQSMVTEILGVEQLAISATWPDAVRSDARFAAFAPFHFLEIGPGSTFETLPPEIRAERDADTIIAQVPDLLLNKKISRDQKIILLKYLVHVVGDVHQPLHVGNGMDMGANLCDIKWKSDGDTMNLHSVMDDRIVAAIKDSYLKRPENSKIKYFSYKDMAENLLKDANIEELQKMAGDPKETWYEESQKLHASVYPDASPVANPGDRLYCKIVDPATKKVVNGKYDATKVPVLTEEYIQKTSELIKRRILLGGYRLANLLNETAKRSGAQLSAENIEQKILDGALISNSKTQRAPNSPAEKTKKSKKKSYQQSGRREGHSPERAGGKSSGIATNHRHDGAD